MCKHQKWARVVLCQMGRSGHLVFIVYLIVKNNILTIKKLLFFYLSSTFGNFCWNTLYMGLTNEYWETRNFPNNNFTCDTFHSPDVYIRAAFLQNNGRFGSSLLQKAKILPPIVNVMSNSWFFWVVLSGPSWTLALLFTVATSVFISSPESKSWPSQLQL